MTFQVDINWNKITVGPPVRVSHRQSTFHVGGASKSLTDTFDVFNGDLIVIIGYTTTNTTTLATPTWTGTGTVTSQESQTGVVGRCNIYLWSIAVTAAADDRNITVGFTGADVWGFSATVWRNHGGVGDTAKGVSGGVGAPLVALTTTSDDSAVEAGFADWDVIDGSSRVWRTINGSSMTEQVYSRPNLRYTIYGAYKAVAGTAGTVNTGLTQPDNQAWTGVAIEILPLASVTADFIDDVTSLVRANNGVSLEYGRDQSTALAPTVSGRGTLTLNNQDRRFSPRNTTSPLYGYLKPARPVRITRSLLNLAYGDIYSDFYTDLYTDSSTDGYTLFFGHTDDSPINPDVDTKTVTLSLVDSLADFRGHTISTQLYAGVRTGEAIGYILDACGWTGGRDLDNGSTVIPWWWVENQDALSALETLMRCEGPPALLTIGSDGSIVFKDRHHRILDAGSITSQGTWRGTFGIEPVMTVPFVYDDAWRNIINTGIVDVDVRTPQGLTEVWTSDSPIALTANEIKYITASSSDPFINAISPIDGIDYILLTGSLSISLSRTSGASTTITLAANASGAQINGLALRAQPVQTQHTVQVTASNDPSIYDYGPRSFPGDLPFCNQHDARAVLETAVAFRAQPLPVVTARFMVGNNLLRASRILIRDLSDRVTIVEPETNLNNDFYVESIQHEFTSEYDHAVTLGLEAVPPDTTVTASNVFLIGGGVGHQIGDGVLAS